MRFSALPECEVTTADQDALPVNLGLVLGLALFVGDSQWESNMGSPVYETKVVVVWIFEIWPATKLPMQTHVPLEHKLYQSGIQKNRAYH